MHNEIKKLTVKELENIESAMNAIYQQSAKVPFKIVQQCANREPLTQPVNPAMNKPAMNKAHGQYVLEDALRKIAVGAHTPEHCRAIAIDAFAVLAKIDGWTRLSEKQPTNGQYCRWFVPTNLFNAHGEGTFLLEDVKINGEVVSAFAFQNLNGRFWLPKEKICWKEMP